MFLVIMLALGFDVACGDNEDYEIDPIVSPASFRGFGAIIQNGRKSWP